MIAKRTVVRGMGGRPTRDDRAVEDGEGLRRTPNLPPGDVLSVEQGLVIPVRRRRRFPWNINGSEPACIRVLPFDAEADPMSPSRPARARFEARRQERQAVSSV